MVWTRRRFLGRGLVWCGACAAGVGRSLLTGDTRSAGSLPRLTNSPTARVAAQPDAVVRVDTTAPVVGLSFDDGPDPRYTPSVIDLLQRAGVRATFFLVGVNAVAHPGLVARLRDGGHTIGNHTYDHLDLERLSPSAVRAEVERGEVALAGAGAGRPTLFRPPKGHTDGAVRVVADSDRYRTVFWDVCVEHHLHGRSLDEGVASALRAVRPGSIIVAHDGGHVLAPGRPFLDRSRTVAALPPLLAGLQRRGFEVVDLPTLLRH